MTEQAKIAKLTTILAAYEATVTQPARPVGGDILGAIWTPSRVAFTTASAEYTKTWMTNSMTGFQYVVNSNFKINFCRRILCCPKTKRAPKGAQVVGPCTRHAGR
jgi:hypothetical protein